jgi:hypothetical protein
VFNRTTKQRKAALRRKRAVTEVEKRRSPSPTVTSGAQRPKGLAPSVQPVVLPPRPYTPAVPPGPPPKKAAQSNGVRA